MVASSAGSCRRCAAALRTVMRGLRPSARHRRYCSGSSRTPRWLLQELHAKVMLASLLGPPSERGIRCSLVARAGAPLATSAVSASEHQTHFQPSRAAMPLRARRLSASAAACRSPWRAGSRQVAARRCFSSIKVQPQTSTLQAQKVQTGCARPSVSRRVCGGPNVSGTRPHRRQRGGVWPDIA